MIKTHIITDRKEIEQLTPQCIELARKAGACLPFNYMHMPLLWWDHFNSNDGTAFWKKRGRNFLGTQSSLEKFHLLITEDDNTIIGLAPFVTYNVKIQGRSDFRILSFAGDYVSIPFQDFLVLPSMRTTVLSSILGKLIKMLNDNHDLLFLGYLPESSLNIPIIRDIVLSFQKQDIYNHERTTSRRGGVWPWTIVPLAAAFKKISNKTEMIQPEVYEELQRISEKLNGCAPQNLLFPGTRNAFESDILSVLEKIGNENHFAIDVNVINSLLCHAPISYPHINLPDDRKAYLMCLSKGTRRYFRRYKKRFEEAVGSFEKIPADDITNRDVDDYIRLHLLRWGEESAAICGASADFHKNISLSMAKEGHFTLFFARYKGQRIAVHSCFDIYPRREGYLTGRDPKHEDLRAGRLLYLETIYDAIDNGFSIYELGVVGFAYKMSFTKTYSISRNFFLYNSEENPDLNKIFTGYECMT